MPVIRRVVDVIVPFYAAIRIAKHAACACPAVRVALVASAVGLWAAPAAAQAQRAYSGTFALQAGARRSFAHALVQRAASPLAATLDLWLTRASSEAPIRSYDLDMAQRLHLIAIGDDLATFVHVHPALGNDGHFRIDLHVPREGLYHLYADWTPHGIGRQVFRFDVPFGDVAAMRRSTQTPSRIAHAGPYTVMLGSLDLRRGSMTMLRATIARAGAPADDLAPYLGAAAHAVFIDTRDLSYVHVHPTVMGEMGGMNVPGMRIGDVEMQLPPGSHVTPNMMFHVAVREAGTYRLWLQFRAGGRLYVAPFTLTSR